MKKKHSPYYYAIENRYSKIKVVYNNESETNIKK